MTAVKHYTDSLHYELLLTTKYFKMFGAQLFEQECIEISPDEMISLDVISCHPNICQRDLARLILKDRANTGRVLDSLEEKGFIVRNLVERNNRAIKQISITKAGEKYLSDVTSVLGERFAEVHEIISEEEMSSVIASLRKLREGIGNIVKTQI